MTTKPTKPKKPAAKKKMSQAHADKLKDLATQISDLGRGAPMGDLIARLKSDHGLKLDETEKDSGIFTASMKGVKTKPVRTERQAMTNWANKARREARAAA